MFFCYFNVLTFGLRFILLFFYEIVIFVFDRSLSLHFASLFFSFRLSVNQSIFLISSLKQFSNSIRLELQADPISFNNYSFTTTILQLMFYNYSFTSTVSQLQFYNYSFTTTVLQQQFYNYNNLQ